MNAFTPATAVWHVRQEKKPPNGCVPATFITHKHGCQHAKPFISHCDWWWKQNLLTLGSRNTKSQPGFGSPGLWKIDLRSHLLRAATCHQLAPIRSSRHLWHNMRKQKWEQRAAKGCSPHRSELCTSSTHRTGCRRNERIFRKLVRALSFRLLTWWGSYTVGRFPSELCCCRFRLESSKAGNNRCNWAARTALSTVPKVSRSA